MTHTQQGLPMDLFPIEDNILLGSIKQHKHTSVNDPFRNGIYTGVTKLEKPVYGEGRPLFIPKEKFPVPIDTIAQQNALYNRVKHVCEKIVSENKLHKIDVSFSVQFLKNQDKDILGIRVFRIF